MKILIVSDTHRYHKYYDKMFEIEEKADLLIHLGDLEGGEYFKEQTAGCPVHMVAGNNDLFTQLPREKEFVLRNKKIFITHGHYYHVSRGKERIIAEAVKRHADIVMYGHTHRPVLEHVDGRNGKILLLNPGSISYPRQPGRQGTYMVMEINEQNEVHVELKYVD